MTINNKSKHISKAFASKMNWVQDGKGNFFKDGNGKLFNFTLTTTKIPQSRQFRLDCDYLASYDNETGIVSIFEKQNLTIDGVTRISPDGTRFFNAKVVENAKPISIF